MGNAIGSNLANMGLVLGVTALLAKLPIQATYSVRTSILLLVTAVAGYTLFDAQLTAFDGILLTGLLAPIMLWMIRTKMRTFTPKKLPPSKKTSAMVKLGPALVCYWFTGAHCQRRVISA